MIELWGGPECTLNRVGDTYGDQLRLTGHHARVADLDLFAEIGFAALRYPALWESIAPDDPEQRDWRWADERLNRIRTLGMRAIVGLIHHGSGPRYTGLLDEGFAGGLAGHARAVAQRYPWIEEWTPVNEPVTTARFSALYGHWYPHQRDERSFWLALLNQIDGVRLSMREVRRINPQARLIQTEDLGRTYATSAMRDQAAFDNVRRWASWDLLTGRVTAQHPFWKRLCGFGLGDRLRAIADDPCPPDVVGINHYLTSDRFLDHRLQRYPDRAHGNNGLDQYADMEALRVLQPPPVGLAGVLREAAARYGLPVAVTEVHNGCTREEQMRWTAEAWQVAIDLRAEGVDVRAVTSWALLGSVGWNTLLTGSGRYEPGAFDVSGGEPRATAMVPMLKGLSAQERLHPVLGRDGWWRRPIRFQHRPTPRPAPMQDQLRAPSYQEMAARPILITGATGTLGQALAAACSHRGLAYLLTSRRELDLGDRESMVAALDTHRPWAVINAAGWVRVDDAEQQRDACMQANAVGAAWLAESCAEREIHCTSFSSDLVFDGEAGTYLESALPAPLNVYGHSKAAAERAISGLPGSHLIIRTAAFFSPFDTHNFAVDAVTALAAERPFIAAASQRISPTYVPDLCNAVLDLVIDGADGIWHLSNGETLSWLELAQRLAEASGLDPALVRAGTPSELGWCAERPLSAGLASDRGVLLPPLQDAIDRFAREAGAKGLLSPAMAMAEL